MFNRVDVMDGFLIASWKRDAKEMSWVKRDVLSLRIKQFTPIVV